MHRVLPVARRTAASTGVVELARQRLATDAADAATTKKKSSFTFRRVIIVTAGVTATFYVGSAFVSFHYPQYRDFFEKNVPLASAVVDFGEQHDWDTLTAEEVLATAQDTFVSVYAWAQKQIGNVKEVSATASDQVKQLSDTTRSVTTSMSEKTKEASASAVRRVKAVTEGTANDAQSKAKAVAITENKAKESTASPSDFPDLVKGVETVLSEGAAAVTTVVSSVPPSGTELNVYAAPLPLGFEPPPGYKRPSPPPEAKAKETKTPAAPEPEPLPLLAPAVAELAVSEPVISHLAQTIDQLAAFLTANPSASTQARTVLDTAQTDLKQLASDFEKLREEEQHKLEQSLDEQAREYSLKLLEIQLDAGDKLQGQQEEYQRLYEEERQHLAQVYREKLEQELLTQSELINERLREEVIAQGIELQRRWIREIKIRVEQERGGRLAKLDELATNIKKLERVALDNSSYLDENLRIHAMWSALRALHGAIDAPARKPFRDELRVLRHIATAKDDPVVSAALDALETSDAPDVGIEPLADLAMWFTTSVAPAVSRVALVPDMDAGVLSHLASHVFSSFIFRRHGLVPGSDVLSVLSRAEYYLNQKDLDSAARELNQLKGTARLLLTDWLEAARRRLEVQQALRVVESEATLKSLLVV
ncbi:mitochondrial inner membrane protein Mitofilin [Vararia minispora EC-137]|uniref:Mitochondrial inner membrane protein Mitofilin n=1 Tax=Vararia minispora EC-137 TaxID=1314806 RepID=A0ACB8QTA1_9AGAM|nr:mitochondrial inner membrane protein Mitofilin [Vararia minispora EC-137]